MNTLWPYLLFAFVASITPGPTNLLVLGNSAAYGWRATLPIIAGASLAAATLVLLVGLGVGRLLLAHPLAQQVMGWVGAAWLTWLAWQLYRSAGQAPESASTPLGLRGAAALQVVNPKTWMMALAVVGVFAGEQAGPRQYALYALLFLLVAVPCLALWACLGRGAARVLRSPAAMRRFNRGMAMLLALSAWAGLLG
ncbi:LysE family translocator [Stutzerimonas azotifigens]|uniref:LysE family translocator n=1 Tax=Stutzerimonas azotifigens TaxID=291995 RepID=UPI0004014023|nr:LysE family translocator [Stutzerimonas azotifigens]